jgi:polyhydroxybutyrate depolymerase
MLNLAYLAAFLAAPATWTVTVDGVERSANVVLPAKPENAPIVFAFHGHGGNSRSAQRSFAIEKAWPEAIVVYPQGLPTVGQNDPEGLRNGWQKRPGEVGDRDLKFFDALWAKAQRELKPDRGRVFAMGHSNGGRFTYLLWAARSDVLTAFGPSASPARGLTATMVPRPAFIVAGRNDQTVSFASQESSIRDVLRLNSLGEVAGKPTGTHITTYAAKGHPSVQTFITDGDHKFPSGCVKPMVEFFRSVPARRR